MDGWIASARYLIAQYREHPEHYPHLTADQRRRLADDLEDCIERVLRRTREPREGPRWWDFEGQSGD